MFEPKPLHKEAIPAALDKAEHYRLLNEPREAESICLDVLQIDPGNQRALILQLLALTDQFERRLSGKFKVAQQILERIEDEYTRVYYRGILFERRAKAVHKTGAPGSGHVAYHWFREAMDCFEKAEAICPDGNDEARLRWNTCVRILQRNPQLKPAPEDAAEHMLE